MVGFIVMLCALVTFPRHPEVGVSALEGMEYRSIAGRLLEAAESGSLVFVNKERDRKLIHGLASLESESVPALTLPLARALESLANISTPQKPLKVTSIFRPLAAGRPNEPHGRKS